jgi:hypothetical protein
MKTSVVSGEIVRVDNARIRLTVSAGGVITLEAISAASVEIEEPDSEEEPEHRKSRNRLHDFLN